MIDDDHATPVPPVLDYGVRPPPRRNAADGPTVRFTAGAAVPVLALLVIAAVGGEDMICCDAIGAVFELFLIGGAFQIGRRLCRWIRGRSLVERHWAITVAAGLVAAGAIIGSLVLPDVLPKPVGGTLCLLGLFVVPAAAPWAALRDEP
jgi:hypothetical protein